MAATRDVATKQDIKYLGSDIDQLRTGIQHELAVRAAIGQLRTEMHEMEARLRIEVQPLRAEPHKEIAAVRSDMGNLAWKVAGLLVAQAAVIITLIRLLPGSTP